MKRGNALFNAVDFFSGAGGFLVALQKAGFNVLFSNEINHKFAKTHEYNFPNIPLINDDIRKVDYDTMMKYTNNKSIDVVVGGPPCQGFSMFGKRRFINTKGYDFKLDPRNDLVYDFIRVIGLLKPKFFMMENVKGFLSLDNG